LFGNSPEYVILTGKRFYEKIDSLKIELQFLHFRIKHSRLQNVLGDEMKSGIEMIEDMMKFLNEVGNQQRLNPYLEIQKTAYARVEQRLRQLTELLLQLNKEMTEPVALRVHVIRAVCETLLEEKDMFEDTRAELTSALLI
jgi:light-regulated signal transduction histidine kinase (bacteriophytochrome)